MSRETLRASNQSLREDMIANGWRITVGGGNPRALAATRGLETVHIQLDHRGHIVRARLIREVNRSDSFLSRREAVSGWLQMTFE